MTSLYFVRHCEPDQNWQDTTTRPLTVQGTADSKKVTNTLKNIEIHRFISSPYKRSVDSIKDCADYFKKEINTDPRLGERRSGDNSGSVPVLERRWADFRFAESGGESLASTQKRNIEAIDDILALYKDENIVVGTHGTALSAIINYYDKDFGLKDFLRILYFMPYIIRLDFDETELLQREELLIDKKTVHTI